MSEKKLAKFKEALIHFGASDLNESILKEIDLKELLLMSTEEAEPRLCFRSAWALEHILLKNPKLLEAVYKELVNNYKELNNYSSLRSYTKLIMWILSKENKNISLNTSELESILEKTFQIVELPDCPVAVRVNGFDILYRLIPYFDWVKNELKLLIEFNLEKESTAAMKSRGITLLNKLNK